MSQTCKQAEQQSRKLSINSFFSLLSTPKLSCFSLELSGPCEFGFSLDSTFTAESATIGSTSSEKMCAKIEKRGSKHFWILSAIQTWNIRYWRASERNRSKGQVETMAWANQKKLCCKRTLLFHIHFSNSRSLALSSFSWVTIPEKRLASRITLAVSNKQIGGNYRVYNSKKDDRREEVRNRKSTWDGQRDTREKESHWHRSLKQVTAYDTNSGDK